MPANRIERETAELTKQLAFDEAVAAPGRKAYVTDTEVKDGTRWLVIYGLGGDGAKQLAMRRVSDGELAARVADFQARGFAVAETDDYPCELVWVRKADGIEVYDGSRKVLDAAGDRATLADGTVVPRADVARVIAYASDDYVSRGIKAVLRSGTEVDLVIEISTAAMANAEGWPTYSRNELICETVWCSTLGVAIAGWAGAPFEDLI